MFLSVAPKKCQRESIWTRLLPRFLFSTSFSCAVGPGCCKPRVQWTTGSECWISQILSMCISWSHRNWSARGVFLRPPGMTEAEAETGHWWPVCFDTRSHQGFQDEGEAHFSSMLARPPQTTPWWMGLLLYAFSLKSCVSTKACEIRHKRLVST